MRVFVAGGTGVIGRRLLPQLVAAGHEVTATTRRQEKAELLHSLGAMPVVLDALDEKAVIEAVRSAAPDVVMNQLTDLPQRYQPRKLGPYFLSTMRLRVDGTRHLLSGARAAGSSRFIFQSIAFMYALSGPMVLDEAAPIAVDAPDPNGVVYRGTLEGERLALEADGIAGVVLRYGQLYGPGTYFAADGDFARQARQRQLPIVAGGAGVFSFLHVDDAASAAVCALTRGRGVYNVVDDEPAPGREWIPVFAEAVGAPKPLRVPAWAATMMAGEWSAAMLTQGRGASNARARNELGWQPGRPSWRDARFDLADPSPTVR
jgi:nucleoside-diphosphate-sugar epimerase